ncbi:hypothetical protein P879_00709 [Paragonimus westermani]|uniref:Cell cycle checkpoint protein n=1 Tax=Paragonimus westermani TaxID=34504 RepID=A0A8T0DQ96_9TREM|nr:hypothetical protein P879_00709 [Paragonimus westermani]
MLMKSCILTPETMYSLSSAAIRLTTGLEDVASFVWVMPRLLKRSVSATEWVMQELTPHTKSPLNASTVPWVDSCAPETEADLVIHPDKVRELSSVLRDIFLNRCVRTSTTTECSPIIILSGPSGSGKTTTLRVLLRSRSVLPGDTPIHIMEWNDESLDSDDFTQLEYFVLQAGRYGTLTAEHSSAVVESESVSFHVIILKNLPVSIADSPSRFHRLLRLYRSRAQPSCLLVLIFTTNSSSNEGVLPERLLCPPSLRNELGIWRVEFNPVAPSLVLKALTRIMSRSNQLPRTLLQLLANECTGDLRTAVNQLQFLAKSGWKKSLTLPKSEANAECRRDTGMIVFRVLGKILHGKRDPHVKRAHGDPGFVADPLPPHLACWKRPPLAFNLDEILDQCQMNGDTIVAWLHENYLDFSPHMHSTQWSADRLSWADAHLSGGMNWRLGLTPAADWNSSQSSTYGARQGVITTSASRHYAALVIARSLLLSHGMADASCDGEITHRSSKSKRFHSFRSPSTHDAWKVARSHSDGLTDVLWNRCQTPLKSASLLITSRRRAILDFIPICLSMTHMKNCFSIDDFEILSSICHIRRAPPSKTSTNRVSKRYESDDSTWRDPDGWICPQDAVLEGEALPIEEDQSDDQLGRGR